MANKIKVLIVDDQEIITRGLKMILNMDNGIEVIGTAGDGLSAFNLCSSGYPDIILMDIKMPVMNGVDATAKIKKRFPEIKIIILTTFNDDQYIFNALKEGAYGYLLKESTPEEIISAVKTVYAGGALIQPSVATRVVEQFSKMAYASTKKDLKLNLLTVREQEITGLVGQGMNNREIATALFLSEGTVRNNISVILSKLELRDRTQLAIFAVKNSL